MRKCFCILVLTIALVTSSCTWSVPGFKSIDERSLNIINNAISSNGFSITGLDGFVLSYFYNEANSNSGSFSESYSLLYLSGTKKLEVDIKFYSNNVIDSLSISEYKLENVSGEPLINKSNIEVAYNGHNLYKKTAVRTYSKELQADGSYLEEDIVKNETSACLLFGIGEVLYLWPAEYVQEDNKYVISHNLDNLDDAIILNGSESEIKDSI